MKAKQIHTDKAKREYGPLIIAGHAQELIDACARIAYSCIAKNANRGSSINCDKPFHDNPKELAKLVKKLDTQVKAKRKAISKGGTFTKNEQDFEEIRGIATVILQAQKILPDSRENRIATAIHFRVIQKIVNRAKSSQGLDLNRYRTRVSYIEEKIRESESVLHAGQIAYANEHDTLEKYDQSDLNFFIDAWHDSSESRKKESARKTDKAFLALLIAGQANGNGMSRTNFYEFARGFIARLSGGHRIACELSPTRAGNFSQLATLADTFKK